MIRRTFLQVVSAAAAGCGGTGEGATAPSGPLAAGNIKDIPVGFLAFVAGQAAILGRDAGGLYAMTGICTHRQCSMADHGGIEVDGIRCDCHQSHYNRDGVVRSGPAPTALAHFEVTLGADGAVVVQCGTVVPASARTKVL